MVLSAGSQSPSTLMPTPARLPKLLRSFAGTDRLSIQCPDQLPRSAWEGTFMQHFPMDVHCITSQHLSNLVAQQRAQQFLLLAGWPCEDFSAAGGRGLAGSRSSAFFDTVRVLGSL